MKVLVIEDSATTRRIIKKNLAAFNLTDIEEAENGEEALAKLDGIDIVLTDWNMPVMDGLTMVKTIRANPKYKDLPIMMITSQAAKKEVIEALKNGVNGYIVKPFTAATLAEKVKGLLARCNPVSEAE
ncbi:response regulator [bacterium]|nr:response regulator [bacterium]MBU1653025.1 response regulator [bacterium]